MQSDAFPTPSIYSPTFQPRLVQIHPEQRPSCGDRYLNFSALLNEVALLINDCSIEESNYFWFATERIKTANLKL